LRSVLIAILKLNLSSAPLLLGFSRLVLLETSSSSSKKLSSSKLYSFISYNKDIYPVFSTYNAFAVLTLAQAKIPSNKAVRGPSKQTPKAK